jgi:hypothetical protein
LDVDRLAQRKSIREKFIEETLASMPVKRFYPLPDDLLADILRTGIVIVGGKGTGKTNAAKVLAAGMTHKKGLQVKITDSCLNWVFNFEPIQYQTIGKDTMVPDDLYFGENHFLYNIELDNVDLIGATIGTMAMTDYAIQREFKKEEVMDDWIVYVIEESQNVIGSYALNGDLGKGFLKYISECRNFNMSNIWIGQRLADISTKAIERCQGYLFLKLTGDNDIKKAERICGKESGVAQVLPKLKIGEGIYWDGEKAVRVIEIPKYQSPVRPVLWRRTY